MDRNRRILLEPREMPKLQAGKRPLAVSAWLFAFVVYAALAIEVWSH